MSKLSDFKIISRLGSGTFGKAYKVRRHIDKNLYVMKKIRVDCTDIPSLKEAVHEARVLASLDCPYIVKYFDSFIDNSALYLILELCDRGDLKTFLMRQMGRLFEETTVWRFFLQLCLGLEYIHYHHILHRDLKPRNVFLMNEHNLRIGDLGLATVLNTEKEFAHTYAGTPSYLSPEVIDGQPYNQKSDVWAIGCLLYELLMLKGPFEANSEGELVIKIRRASYPPINPKYSYEIRNIVKLCLNRDPDKRPTVSDILKMNEVRDRISDLDFDIPKTSIVHRGMLRNRRAEEASKTFVVKNKDMKILKSPTVIINKTKELSPLNLSPYKKRIAEIYNIHAATPARRRIREHRKNSNIGVKLTLSPQERVEISDVVNLPDIVSGRNSEQLDRKRIKEIPRRLTRPKVDLDCINRLPLISPFKN